MPGRSRRRKVGTAASALCAAVLVALVSGAPAAGGASHSTNFKAGGSAKPHLLQRGERWERIGVHCVRRAVLRCRNADGHGFRLTYHRYRAF